MKFGLILISCLISGLALLPRCGDTGDQPTQAQEVQKPAANLKTFTVKQAKQAVWPPAGEQGIQKYDSLLTRQNLMAILDMSGSMGESDCSGRYATKAAAAKDALITWLDGIPRKANVGLIIFSYSKVKLEVPLGVDNRKIFKRAVKNSSPSGGTPLQTALALAHQELEKRARFQNGYGDYRLVVITDGQHNPGEDPKPVVNEILNNPANPVQIYTIGFCITDSALNQPDRIIYQSANTPEELKKGLDRVLAESTRFNADLIKEFQ